MRIPQIMMNRIRINLRGWLPILLLSSWVLCSSTIGQESRSRKSIQAISDQIDDLVQTKLSSDGIQRNKRSDDSVFLRRIYLDVIGRIPNLEETQTFLASKNKSKRADLIDKLLDSYGRTSRQFNYWADLLRIKSRTRGGLSGQLYIKFVKDSLDQNQPYDEFVRELLTASGASFARNNGAVGYYLRDRNMPEDNMSNTIRIFLGTRLECAQCHDHPYDDWTQRQYFEMAAFTGGMRFRTHDDYTRKLRQQINKLNLPENLRRKVSQFVKAIGSGIDGGGTGLTRLPENFLGDDGEDNEIVVAREMFDRQPITGAKIPRQPSLNNSDLNNKNKRQRAVIAGSKDIGAREIYADWLTDPENPRFATVIANRLWKQAMGIGLIEPVDIIEEGMDGSNPKLMKYLAKTMIDLDFDMKQFQRAIYLSETYQASAFTSDVIDMTTYSFQGPIVRRMTAEQIWDSLLTLVVAETDVRHTNPSDLPNGLSYEQFEGVLQMSPEQAIEFATQWKQQNRKQNKALSSRKKKAKHQAELSGLSNGLQLARKTNDSVAIKKLTEQRAKLINNFRRSQSQFARASEMPSPAPANHFLREFGQSDREAIDNSNSDPSIPQVLSMMNGLLEKNVCRNKDSTLMQQAMQAKSSQECIETVFLTMLSRKPNHDELKVWQPDFDSAINNRRNKSQMREAFADLIWTIANSTEFIFQK